MQRPLTKQGTLFLSRPKCPSIPSQRRFHTCRKGLVVKAEPKKSRDYFDEYEKWLKRMRIEWRLKRFEWIDKMEDEKQKFKETAFMVSLYRNLAVMREKLDPLFKIRDWIMERIFDYVNGFHEFVMEEAKREWRWSNEYEIEIDYWRDALFYLQHMVMTLLCLTFVPPSMVRGILCPMLAGYFMHERFWTSPQAIVVYLTLPLRYRWGYPVSFL